MQLQVWPILSRAKVPTKVLQVKTPLLPVGHPRRPDPPKVLPKTLQGAVLKVPPKAQKKASFKEKVSLHLPFLHLPPIFRPLDLLADHKFPQRPHSYLPNFNGQPGHIVRFASSKLPSSGFMLSSFIPNSAPISILLSRIFPLCTPPFISSFLYSSSHPTSLWPAWAYCPARRLIFQSPLPPSLLLYSAYSFLSPFPRPSPAPSFGPRVFSRCSPNVALPNEAAPVVDRARRCGLSPCRAINWCRLCAQLSTSAAPMCRLCCRCELCSLKRRTINSTTPCVLASSLTLRIFPAHPILDIRWNLFHAPTLSLPLFAPLIWFTLGEIGSDGSA